MPLSTEEDFETEEANAAAAHQHSQDGPEDMPEETSDEDMPMPGTPPTMHGPTAPSPPDTTAPTTAQLNMQHTDWLEAVHTRVDELLTINHDKLNHYLGFETLDTFYTTFSRICELAVHDATATLSTVPLPPLPLYQGRGKVQIKKQQQTFVPKKVTHSTAAPSEVHQSQANRLHTLADLIRVHRNLTPSTWPGERIQLLNKITQEPMGASFLPLEHLQHLTLGTLSYPAAQTTLKQAATRFAQEAVILRQQEAAHRERVQQRAFADSECKGDDTVHRSIRTSAPSGLTILADSEDKLHSTPLAVDKIAREAWNQVYDGNPKAHAEIITGFLQRYHSQMHHAAPRAPPAPISGPSLHKEVMAAASTASGMDNWAPADMKVLSPLAFTWLAALLNKNELRGRLPPLRHEPNTWPKQRRTHQSTRL